MSIAPNLYVPAPVPTISSITPSRVVVGWGLSLPVALTGSGYTGATTLFVDNERFTMDARTSTRILFTFPPRRIATPCTMHIRVETPAPGGGVAVTQFVVASPE